MNYRWLLLLACLLLPACDNSENTTVESDESKPNASASDAVISDSESAKSAAQMAFESADKEYAESYESFLKEIRALPESEQAAFASNAPEPEAYVDRFMAIAEEHPDDPAAFDSLFWIARSRIGGDAAKRVFKILLEDHIENKKLGDLCFGLMYSKPSPEIEARIKTLLERSPHEQVKAMATFALANYYVRLDAGSVKESEIEALYKSLISNYSEIKMHEQSNQTFGQMAERSIFELQNLSVGKIAPDIEGEDLDGITFKLSDYRGKIVVLDFWGDW
ncbi:peroxiredoxin family protein [Mariniblastus fucicola]|uniref:peroxiredoxin family protein n=1 Tax=Mariniblastus fucicola TaxID=980251 RepID=UPI0012F7AE8D|nr:redoxin domain-containing protein [Mariniblastus fucicola]